MSFNELRSQVASSRVYFEERKAGDARVCGLK